jgi:hypothetical protein
LGTIGRIAIKPTIKDSYAQKVVEAAPDGGRKNGKDSCRTVNDINQELFGDVAKRPRRERP